MTATTECVYRREIADASTDTWGIDSAARRSVIVDAVSMDAALRPMCAVVLWFPDQTAAISDVSTDFAMPRDTAVVWRGRRDSSTSVCHRIRSIRTHPWIRRGWMRRWGMSSIYCWASILYSDRRTCCGGRERCDAISTHRYKRTHTLKSISKKILYHICS